ncbi:unnamed protein product [Microthlaspi erraticum]|uniref:Uncharacterized protein n=1 Tax=Microthlaspi erraticum TaxID=1685480 RepID=A0A6D2JVS4_9BRAS|nr:unnamed protein product [Microthlaspi erraticum]
MSNGPTRTQTGQPSAVSLCRWIRRVGPLRAAVAKSSTLTRTALYWRLSGSTRRSTDWHQVFKPFGVLKKALMGKSKKQKEVVVYLSTFYQPTHKNVAGLLLWFCCEGW